MINLFLQVTLVCVAPAYLDSILPREIKSQPNSLSAHSRQEFQSLHIHAKSSKKN